MVYTSLIINILYYIEVKIVTDSVFCKDVTGSMMLHIGTPSTDAKRCCQPTCSKNDLPPSYSASVSGA
ncbi:hypothetical protein AAVH_12241 [Aphelenchoides avenae]|nr:hypothetical protein AAVH_12241 [Aphelenchus avenae]